MASKSRLGKGLGALFPTLPEDAQDTEHHDADSEADSDGVPERSQQAQGNLNSARVDPGVTQYGFHQGSNTAARPPKSLSQSVSRETSKRSVRQRASIPSLDALSHPTDVFFGEQQDTTKYNKHQQQPGSNSTAERQATSHDSIGSTADAAVNTRKHANTGRPDRNKTRKKPQSGVTVSSKPKAEVSANSHSSELPEQSDLQPVAGGYLTSLQVEDIQPNPQQPRAIFDEDELQELADSISEVGVLQPIVVRKRADDTASGTRYELIMGERRWRASRRAGLAAIPAIVKTTSDDVMLRDALLENLQRVDLNPLEEAAAYQQMIDEFGLTQAQLSKSVSKSRPQIANTLRLLNLPATVQKRVAAGVLSAGHARALLGAGSEHEMEILADRIVAEGLSVRDAEEIVAVKTSVSSQQKPRKPRQDAWVRSEVQTKLEDRFDTQVSIRGNRKKGRIEIVFSSPEDMNRILDLLMPSHDDPQSSGWV